MDRRCDVLSVGRGDRHSPALITPSVAHISPRCGVDGVSMGRARRAAGVTVQWAVASPPVSCLPPHVHLSPRVSACLPMSPHVCPCLSFSPHLSTSPRIFQRLSAFSCVSPCLGAHRHISLHHTTSPTCVSSLLPVSPRASPRASRCVSPFIRPCLRASLHFSPCLRVFLTWTWFLSSCIN